MLAVGTHKLASVRSALLGSSILGLFDRRTRRMGSGMLALCDAVELGLLSMATKIASTVPEPSSSSSIVANAGLFGGPGGGRGLLTFGIGLIGAGRSCLVRSLFGGNSGGGAFLGGGAFFGGVAGDETYGMSMFSGEV